MRNRKEELDSILICPKCGKDIPILADKIIETSNELDRPLILTCPNCKQKFRYEHDFIKRRNGSVDEEKK